MMPFIYDIRAHVAHLCIRGGSTCISIDDTPLRLYLLNMITTMITSIVATAIFSAAKPIADSGRTANTLSRMASVTIIATDSAIALCATTMGLIVSIDCILRVYTGEHIKTSVVALSGPN